MGLLEDILAQNRPQQDFPLRGMPYPSSADYPRTPMPAMPDVPQADPDDQIRQRIMALLGRRNSIASRLGPLPVPNSPMVKQQHPRLFLRGLAQGFNNQTNNVGSGQEMQIRTLLQLLQANSRVKANEALAGQRDARTAEINEPPVVKPEKDDPFYAEKKALYDARVATEKEQADAARALAERRRRAEVSRATGGGGRSGGGAGSSRAELAARYRAKLNEMTARVAAIGAKEGWSKEEIKAAQERQRARISDEYSALLKGQPITEDPSLGGPASAAPKALTREDVKARL